MLGAIGREALRWVICGASLAAFGVLLLIIVTIICTLIDPFQGLAWYMWATIILGYGLFVISAISMMFAAVRIVYLIGTAIDRLPFKGNLVDYDHDKPMI